jgi:multiple sugar transport system permease protein
MLKPLGLINTYGGAIVPAMASIFGIFLVRQFARTIPDDLLEAARIDGASEFRIFPDHRRPAARAGARHAGDLQLPRQLERLHVAADRADRRCAAHVPVALAGLSREHVQDSELMMPGRWSPCCRCWCCSSRCSASTWPD